MQKMLHIGLGYIENLSGLLPILGLTNLGRTLLVENGT
jgi:hypothetical protein